jgi:hypothetical protein
MNTRFEMLKTNWNMVAEKAKVRKGMLSILAVFFVVQIYFVRELLAAELLFGMGFAVLFGIGLIFYLVGTLGERGLDWAETGVRVVATSARRGYASLEEITRKTIRDPRSESAQ